MKLLSLVKASQIESLPFPVEVVARDLRLNDLEVPEDLAFGANGDPYLTGQITPAGPGTRCITPNDVRNLAGYVLIRFDSKAARKALGGRIDGCCPSDGAVGIPAHCPRLS